jgi:predicted DNA-binding protein with PD1-like motif
MSARDRPCDEAASAFIDMNHANGDQQRPHHRQGASSAAATAAATSSSSSFLMFALIAVALLTLVSVVMSGVALGRSSESSPSLSSSSSGSPPPSSAVGFAADSSGTVAVRLFPGDDLLGGIMRVVNARRLRAAWIVSCVGSLTQWAIRFANEPTITVGPVAHFEIVSLVGTMTANNLNNTGTDSGAWHVHISVADSTGRTVGGHLAAAPNSTIYTTAEIVIGFACAFEFSRAVDGSTPWDELQIRQRRWC